MATLIPQLLELVLAEASESIVPNSSALRSLGERLPDAPYGLLEVRLDPSNSQVDFSQGFRQIDKTLLQDWLRTCPDHPNWQPLRHFVDAWLQPSGAIANAVAEAGLEFDLPGNSDHADALPNLFFRPFDDWSGSSAPRNTCALIEAVCDKLFPKARAAEIANASNALILKLPNSAQLNHVGIMLGRDVNTMRLQLRDIPLSSITDLLDHLEIKGGFDELQKLAKKHFTHGVVCLDVAPNQEHNPTPSIGLELFDTAANHKDSYARLLTELVNAKLCSDEKRLGVLAWPGIGTPGQYVGEWQSNLKPADANEMTFLTVPREISHIKLTSDGSRTLSAKAYLEFRQKKTILQRI